MGGFTTYSTFNYETSADEHSGDGQARETSRKTNSVIHTTHLLELSGDLPVVIEVVDSEEHVERLMPILEEMLDDGMVTIEKVRVLRYKASAKLG